MKQIVLNYHALDCAEAGWKYRVGLYAYNRFSKICSFKSVTIDGVVEQIRSWVEKNKVDSKLNKPLPSSLRVTGNYFGVLPRSLDEAEEMELLEGLGLEDLPEFGK